MNEWYSRSIAGASLILMAACSTVRYSSDYDRLASFSEFRTYGWEALSEDEGAALARLDPFLERRLQRAVDSQLADRGFTEASHGDPDVWVSAYPVIPPQAANARGPANRGYPITAPPRSSVSVSFGFGFGYGYPYAFGYPYFGFGYPYAFGYQYFGFGYPYFGFGYPNFGFWAPYFGYPYRFGYRYPYYGFGRYGPYRGVGFYPGIGVTYTTAPGFGYPAGSPVGGLQIGSLVVEVTDAKTGELVWRGWADGALQEAPGPDQLPAYIDDVVAKIMKDFPPTDGST
jgi:hypothetical protein